MACMKTNTATKSTTKTQDRRTISAKTLEKLRATILELFSSGLYQDVGIRDICSGAKVSPQTVYKYFGNKEEMLYACIKADLDGLNRAMIESAQQHSLIAGQVRAILTVWCDFYCQNPGIARIVFLNIPLAYWVGERQFVQSALHDALHDRVSAGQQQGEVWEALPADILNEVLMGAAYRLMVRWLSDEALSAEAVKSHLIAAALQLIAPVENSCRHGWLSVAGRTPSPNFNQRPAGEEVSLLVIHNISLPPGEFGTGCIEDFFCNKLDIDRHPFFQEIENVQVSAHLLIDRQGRVTQFVGFDERAWHAGQSLFDGRDNCNDFSIGIELEGTDDQAYTEAQYQALVDCTRAIQRQYPAITSDRIVGHSDIAPGRKTDPGNSFDWSYYKNRLEA